MAGGGWADAARACQQYFEVHHRHRSDDFGVITANHPENRMRQSPSSPDPLPLDYQPTPEKRWLRGGWGALVLQLVTAYFFASILTLPFIDALWFGEVPVLALIQLPKIAPAGWLRSDVVMPAIRAMGLSRGSFSPDFILARPYGLAIAYVLILGVVFVVLWISGQMSRSSRWVWITLGAALIDFVFTLWFAGGPGLTIY
jgi:hypothetical protein